MNRRASLRGGAVLLILVVGFLAGVYSDQAFPDYLPYVGHRSVSKVDLTELQQHGSHLEADLEALLQRGWALRQYCEDTQRLLEPAPGVPERPPRGRLESRLAEIVHRLVPHLAPEGVMG